MMIYPMMIYPMMRYPMMIYPMMIYPMMIYPMMTYPMMVYPMMAYPMMIYPMMIYPMISMNPMISMKLGVFKFREFPKIFYSDCRILREDPTRISGGGRGGNGINLGRSDWIGQMPG